jgi:hypothetical protein
MTATGSGASFGGPKTAAERSPGWQWSLVGRGRPLFPPPATTRSSAIGRRTGRACYCRFPIIVGSALAAGQPVSLVRGGRARHSFIAVDDVAEFAVRVVGHPAATGQRLVVGGPEPLTWADIVARTAAILGRPLPVRSIEPGEPIPTLPAPVRRRCWRDGRGSRGAGYGHRPRGPRGLLVCRSRRPTPCSGSSQALTRLIPGRERANPPRQRRCT